MAALDLTPGFAKSDVALPLPLQAVALLLQEDIGQHSQGPEAHESDRTHQLILIPAQFFLAIAEEDLNVPPSRDMGEQHLWARLQITGGPITCLREWGIQRLAYDDHLAAVELAHPRVHHRHIDLLVTLGPLEPMIVARTQVRGVVQQLLPTPALG